jgi:hypothetical protein
LLQTGWGVFQVETNQKYPDNQQMYAAGYLEGYLTAHRIYEMYLSMYDSAFGSSSPTDALYNFLSEQDAWTRDKIKTHANDPYWQQVSFIMSQFDGLVDGYAQSNAEVGICLQFIFSY